MVGSVKIFLSSSLIAMQKLVVVHHAAWAYVGNLKIWGRRGLSPWDSGRA